MPLTESPSRRQTLPPDTRARRRERTRSGAAAKSDPPLPPSTSSDPLYAPVYQASPQAECCRSALERWSGRLRANTQPDSTAGRRRLPGNSSGRQPEHPHRDSACSQRSLHAAASTRALLRHGSRSHRPDDRHPDRRPANDLRLLPGSASEHLRGSSRRSLRRFSRIGHRNAECAVRGGCPCRRCRLPGAIFWLRTHVDAAERGRSVLRDIRRRN